MFLKCCLFFLPLLHGMSLEAFGRYKSGTSKSFQIVCLVGGQVSSCLFSCKVCFQMVLGKLLAVSRHEDLLAKYPKLKEGEIEGYEEQIMR
jgi:hypothetical protein